MSSESASLYSTTSTVPASLYSVSSKTLLKSEEAPSPRRSSSSKSRALFAKIFKSDHSTPARSPKTPEEIFREIMSINAHSGAPQVKAWMYHSEWEEKRAVPREEKRAVPTEKTAKKKPLKSTTRAPLRTSQETAEEIMRLNATHGHPDVKAYLASLK
ncbi:hypothetical protein RHOSPDRAFT_36661 [Rhodotorula sp. JG-1b]|nr:hypothetical protein RHOSPDRAFT_36661 [Rhodotorula sp. JG-1b]